MEIMNQGSQAAESKLAPEKDPIILRVYFPARAVPEAGRVSFARTFFGRCRVRGADDAGAAGAVGDTCLRLCRPLRLSHLSAPRRIHLQGLRSQLLPRPWRRLADHRVRPHEREVVFPLIKKNLLGLNRLLGGPLWRMHGCGRMQAAERGCSGAIRTRRTRGGCGGRAAEGPAGADHLRERARGGEGRRRCAVAVARRKKGADGAEHVHAESFGGGGSSGSMRSTTSMVPAYQVGQHHRASASSASCSDCASGEETGGTCSRRRHRSGFCLRRGPASSL